MTTSFWSPWHRQAGFSLVESIWLWPILVMLTLGSIQMALMFKARATLNNATFLAAREGAIHHANKSMMLTKLGEAMAPIYMGKNPNIVKLEARQLLEAGKAHAGKGMIEVISPTPDLFKSFSKTQYVLEKKGGKVVETTREQIPNDNLNVRSSKVHAVKIGGKKVEVNLQDANLLKIRAHWCYELKVPFVDKLIRQGMKTLGSTSHPLWKNCTAMTLATGDQYVPISGHSIVRMQSAVRCSDKACSNLK